VIASARSVAIGNGLSSVFTQTYLVHGLQNVSGIQV
jgi:hypothetical protein